MSYPKPLSEKSLEKLYKESGLTDEARFYLHKVFAACTNLYGAISLRHIWTLYGELKDAPKLRRKDILTFASIVRREEQQYYVFEIEELYTEEKHNADKVRNLKKESHPSVLVCYNAQKRIGNILSQSIRKEQLHE